MSAPRVDFRALRAQLDFAVVLAHYNVNGKRKGEAQWHGFCPLPSHQSKETKPKSPSFSAHCGKGLFHCFGCGGKGNVLEFIALMEGLDPDDPQQFRKAALRAQELFSVGSERPPQEKKEQAPKSVIAEEPEVPAAIPEDTAALHSVINAPLTFTLQTDPQHPYLRDRGLTEETIARFGLGYAGKGLMQGRIAIPLHDHAGQLIGYAGRLVDDDRIGEDAPKYRFPGERIKDGTRFEFRKSLFLYNAHRIAFDDLEQLVIVEGFPSVWWMVQHGIDNVVAVMGASISSEQADLIVMLTSGRTRIVVMPDGDSAGTALAQKVFELVGTRRFVRWARLEQGKQPTDCAADALRTLL